MKTLSSDLYRNFLPMMRDVRVQAKLSQAQLAERLGRPQSFVSKYESGERRLDVVEFIVICNAIGIAPEKLVKKLAR